MPGLLVSLGELKRKSAACLIPSMACVDCMLTILIGSQAVEHVRQGLKAQFAHENCSIYVL